MSTRANIIITDNKNYTKIFYQHSDGFVNGGLGEVLMCELEDYCFTHNICDAKTIAETLSLYATTDIHDDVEFLYVINVEDFKINLKIYDLMSYGDTVTEAFNFIHTLHLSNYQDVLPEKILMFNIDYPASAESGTPEQLKFIKDVKNDLKNEDANLNISNEKLYELYRKFTELHKAECEKASFEEISLLKTISYKLDAIINLMYKD